MYPGDDLRAAEDQHVDVVCERDRMSAEPVAAHSGLIQLLLMDHRPHRAVEDQDPLPQQIVETCAKGHLFTLTPNAQLPTANHAQIPPPNSQECSIGNWELGVVGRWELGIGR